MKDKTPCARSTPNCLRSINICVLQFCLQKHFKYDRIYDNFFRLTCLEHNAAESKDSVYIEKQNQLIITNSLEFPICFFPHFPIAICFRMGRHGVGVPEKVIVSQVTGAVGLSLEMALVYISSRWNSQFQLNSFFFYTCSR